MSRRDLGDRVLDWEIYGDEYARVVYDESKYAVYAFDSTGNYRRHTGWHLGRDEALQEYLIISQGE